MTMPDPDLHVPPSEIELAQLLTAVSAALGPSAALVLRRLKWHVAEHNRIKASWDSFDEESQGLALTAMAQHMAGRMECEAILREEEPNWGDEREITEAFLEPASEEGL